jgi:hypothetical protein
VRKRKKTQPNQWQRFFGATGYTGRFVTAELSRRDMTPIAVARDAKAPSTTDFPDGEVMRRHQHSESQLAKLGSQLLSCARLASDFPMIVRDV